MEKSIRAVTGFTGEPRVRWKGDVVAPRGSEAARQSRQRGSEAVDAFRTSVLPPRRIDGEARQPPRGRPSGQGRAGSGAGSAK
jgi:hypothetical protein